MLYTYQCSTIKSKQIPTPFHGKRATQQRMPKHRFLLLAYTYKYCKLRTSLCTVISRQYFRPIITNVKLPSSRANPNSIAMHCHPSCIPDQCFLRLTHELAISRSVRIFRFSLTDQERWKAPWPSLMASITLFLITSKVL